MKRNHFAFFGRTSSELRAKTSYMGAWAIVGLLALGTISGCEDAAAADSNTPSAVEQRLEMLETKEAIREAVLQFAHIVDTEDEAALEALAPNIHPDFEMRVVDFVGAEHKFVGYDGLISGYGPIMVIAGANLAVSQIGVQVDGDIATASFKFINSVKPPPQLGIPVNEKLLLLAANTAVFVKTNSGWQLEKLELIHSLAYPGELPANP